MCPNKNLEEWLNLVKEFGEGKALALFDLNNEEIPSIEKAHELISSVIPTAESPTLFDNSLPFNEAVGKIISGFTKYGTLKPKRVGDVVLKGEYTTATGKAVDSVAKALEKWVSSIPDFSSVKVEYSPVHRAIRFVPKNKLSAGTITATPSTGQGITQGSQVTPAYTPTIGLTPKSNLFLTSESTKTPAEQSFDKLIQTQKELELDSSDDPKTGQRRHQYTLTKNGVKRDLGPSVTSTIEKTFVSSEDAKEFNLSLADRGTEIHQDIENEIKSYLTDDFQINVLKKDNLERNTPTTVFATIRTFAGQIIEHYKNLNIPGIKIIPECKVVDESYNNGVGLPGTIDLLVLFPDGSYDKYDWKSMYRLSSKKRVDMQRKGYYKEQADKLADILKKYGLTDRRMDMMIPIDVLGSKMYNTAGIADKLNLEAIQVSPFNFGNLDPEKMYLQPIVINYQEPDDKEIGNLIKQYDKVIKHILKAGKLGDEATKVIAAQEAARIEKAIFDTVFRKDISTLTNAILSEINLVQNVIKNNDRSVDLTPYIERMTNVYSKTGTFVQKRLKDGRKEINDISKRLQDSDLTSDEKTLLEDNKRIIQDRLLIFNDTILKVQDILKGVVDYANQYTQSQSDLAGFGDVLLPELEMKFGDKWLTKSTQIEKSILMLTMQKIHQAIAESQLKREEYAEEIIHIVDELKKNVKGDLLDFYRENLIEKGNNGYYRLRQMYDKNFYENKKKAELIATSTNIEEGGVNWFKENTVFNRERYNRDLKTLEDTYDKRISLGSATEEEKTLGIDEFKSKWDVGENFINTDALLHGDYGNKYVIPNEKWYSEDYKKIKKNPTLLKFHEAIIKYNLMLAEKGFIREGQAYSFFPQIENTFAQSWQHGNRENLGDLIERFSDSVTVSESELNSKGNLNPITGEPVLEQTIPYITSSITPKRQSADVGLVYKMMTESIALFDELQKIEADLKQFLTTEKNKGMLPTLKRGGVSTVPVENTTNYVFLQNMIDFIMYGKDTSNDSTVKVWNNFFTRALKLSGKNLSLNKSVDAIVSYNTVLRLYLSLSSISSNLVGGTGNLSFYAKSGQFFTTKNLLQAEGLVIRRDKKAKALIKFFDPHTEDSAGRELSKQAAAKSITPSISRIGMSGMSFTDSQIQEVNAVAHFLSHMINDNGEIVNIRQSLLRSEEGKRLNPKDVESTVEKISKEKSLYTTAKIDDKGKPYWEDKDGNKVDLVTVKKGLQAERTKLQRAIKEISNRVIGAVTPDDKMGANLNPLTRPIFNFRTWIMGLVNARFKGIRYMTATGTYEEGRYGLFGELFKHMSSSANILFTLLGGDKFAPNVQEAAQEAYRKRKADYEKKNPGKEFNMDEAEYLHQYVGTIKSYSRELLALVGFLFIAMLIKPDKDDSDEVKARAAFMSKFLNKFYGEFSFYGNPKEAQQLLGNAVPAVGLLTDLMKLITSLEQEIQGLITNDEQMIKKAHPLKYGLQFLPAVKQLEDIGALMSSDFRKSMDISLSHANFY